MDDIAEIKQTLAEQGVVLQNILGRQGEVLEELHQINGYVREHGELLAAHTQWQKSHQHEHKELTRKWIAGDVIGSIGAAVAGIFAGLSRN